MQLGRHCCLELGGELPGGDAHVTLEDPASIKFVNRVFVASKGNVQSHIFLKLRHKLSQDQDLLENKNIVTQNVSFPSFGFML